MMTLAVMTTFTILTTATTLTIRYRSQLKAIQSKAATKIDALSGEPPEDIDQSPPTFVDGPPEKIKNMRLV